MAKPEVSVIVPVYNCDRYIAQAIESVLNQTYTDYEIIVIDDGSTDNTREVLESYRGHINYLYQENQGVAMARNRGIEIAKGQFVAFLDHDDFFLPNKLALQVTFLKTKIELGIVHSGWYRVNSMGETQGEVEPWHQAPNLNLEEWVQWKPVLLSAMMFRKICLDRIGGFDREFQQACDVDLALRLTLMGCQSGWLYQKLVCYREHDRNASLDTPIQAQESWMVLDRFFALPNVPGYIKEKEKSYRYHTLVWSAWRLYYTGHLSEMAQYLEKSLSYTLYSQTQTISDWIKNFVKYGSEFGFSVDTYLLSNSSEWENLMERVISNMKK